MSAIMKKTKKNCLSILCLALTIVIFGGIYVKNRAGAAVTQYAWVAYWDADSGIEELDREKNNLAGVSVFALNFDEHGKFVYPREWKKLNDAVTKTGVGNKYLTVVNDVFSTKGRTFPKDLKVLKLLFRDEKTSLNHVTELIKETKKGGYDGLEIDYEGLWKDPDLVKKYQLFLQQLAAESAKANLPVRIILEPSASFGQINWPQGPEYVVMLYNLYGTHSTQDGPKANALFIAKTILSMSYLPENKGVAFSLGGCRWLDGSKGVFLSTAEVRGLDKYKKGEPIRDAISHAMHFTYEKAGKTGVCWYADTETLRYWTSIAKTLGIKKIFLWRLGHNF
jgi:spore germination protein YaaH